jgi:hypothetical protein
MTIFSGKSVNTFYFWKRVGDLFFSLIRKTSKLAGEGPVSDKWTEPPGENTNHMMISFKVPPLIFYWKII